MILGGVELVRLFYKRRCHSVPSKSYTNKPHVKVVYRYFSQQVKAFRLYAAAEWNVTLQMRYRMRRILFVMPFVVVIGCAQTMTEVGASAAGSAIGSAGGKKISEGINSIFGKVDSSTARAARPVEVNASYRAAPIETPPIKPPQAPSGGAESVPPPPPPAHRASPPKPAPAPEPLPEIVPPPPPPPPAPQATAEDLKKVANGTSREDLLKLGAPASRITMSDDGHVLEVFSYADKDTSLGRVRLTDGTVSSVEIR